MVQPTKQTREPGAVALAYDWPGELSEVIEVYPSLGPALDRAAALAALYGVASRLAPVRQEPQGPALESAAKKAA